MGRHPRVFATTTPRAIKLLRTLLKDPGTIVIKGTTFDNAANFGPNYLDRVKTRYFGTRLGAQQRQQIEDCRIDPKCLPDMQRVVVAIDPSAQARMPMNPDIVAGKGVDGKAMYLKTSPANYHRPPGQPARSPHIRNGKVTGSLRK